MFTYESASTSPYKVFEAAATIENPYIALTLTENGAKVSTAGDIPIGLSATETRTCQAGEDINVQISGIGLWQVGETIKQGDLLSAGADGKAVKTTAGNFIFARALESGDAGAIHVQIICAGVKGA